MSCKKDFLKNFSKISKKTNVLESTGILLWIFQNFKENYFAEKTTNTASKREKTEGVSCFAFDKSGNGHKKKIQKQNHSVKSVHIRSCLLVFGPEITLYLDTFRALNAWEKVAEGFKFTEEGDIITDRGSRPKVFYKRAFSKKQFTMKYLWWRPAWVKLPACKFT